MTGSSPVVEKGYLADIAEEPKDTPAETPADVKADSSPAADQKDVEPAESLPADAKKDVKAPETLLDRVMAAAKVGVEEPSASEPKKDQAAAKEGEAKPEDGKAEDGDEKLPFGKHPRWQEMVRQRNAFKEKADALDQFVGGVSSAGLSIDEFNTGLSIMAEMKRDPGKAWELLKPYVDSLQAATGQKLPDTLVKQVEDGEITEAAAKRLAKAEADAARLAQRAQDSEAARAERNAMDRQKSLADAGNSWEAARKTTDPDWDKKRPFVERAAAALIAQYGPPPTPADVVTLMEAANRQVEKDLGQFRPAKAAVKPPVTASGASASTQPRAKTMREAMEQAASLA